VRLWHDRLVTITVLLVDDDSTFRGLVRIMLSASGFVVVGEADTVASALVAVRELRPDSALVDVELPDGDGITLAGRLTALADGPRVVLTSTDVDAADPEDVARSGAAGFVPKADLPSVALEGLLAGS
jgi:DNA-binding NarL/FixJ family response regulator